MIWVKISVITLVVLLSASAFGGSGSVTSKTYNELTEIQEIMGAGNGQQAFERLTALLTAVEEGSIDQALTLQTLGYVEMARENFKAAIGHLKGSLALEKLPQNVVFNIGYVVAQLHAALGEYNEALRFASEWFANLEAPKPSQYIFMANIYAQTKVYKESIPYTIKAIALAPAPKETWYQLLTASYFELKQFNNAAKTLQEALNYWPHQASYWEQLASVYVMLNNESKALATLKIAFSQKVLKKEPTVKSLVQLAVMQGIPEHAARLLEAGFAAEILPEDENYLAMLAVALSESKERDGAIRAYERMAAVTDKGDPWISIANLYVEKAEWADAEKSLRKALDSELDNPGKAWLLMGIAQAEQQKFEAAKKSLKKAGAFEDAERSASRWLKYNDDLKRQADWLAEHR